MSSYIASKLLANERRVTPGYTPQFSLPGRWGIISPGNLDLKSRPVVRNGSQFSTVRTITVTDDRGRAYLLPTVVNGGLVSNQQAIQHWRQTGQHLGVFGSEAQADRYAQALHFQQARLYGV